MLKRVGEARRAIDKRASSFTASLEQDWSTAKQSFAAPVNGSWRAAVQRMNSYVVSVKRGWGAILQKMETSAALMGMSWSTVAQRLRHDIAFQVGVGLMMVGVLFGFLHFYQEAWILGVTISVFKDFYANVSTEFISIAITVLIINSLYQRRQEEHLKAQLIEAWS